MNTTGTNEWSEWLIGVLVVVAAVGGIIIFSNLSTIIEIFGGDAKVSITCEDVTSYDYNWDNDMRCTNADGSIFYTNYSDAAAYENSQ